MYPVKGAKNDQYSFYCIPCLKNDHQGITDVKNHCSTATRKGYEKQATSQPSVSPSFKSQDPKDSVTRAEVMLFEKIANNSKKYIFLIRSRWSTREKRYKSTMKLK